MESENDISESEDALFGDFVDEDGDEVVFPVSLFPTLPRTDACYRGDSILYQDEELATTEDEERVNMFYFYLHAFRLMTHAFVYSLS